MIDDFRDFLQAFVAAGVDFLVVGAHALQVHGVPRATGDLDVWVRPSESNAQRVMAALIDFGAPVRDLGIKQDDFATQGIIAQLGLPPYRIDILTAISGVDFDSAFEERLQGTVAGVLVPVLGRESFIRNKRASGRKKDLADIEYLENT
ncbi:MAG: hypothetical protein M3Z05_07780 [Gemmatimonadota bacterium]|nr:hypothetical protein [Gemmatimonadota bacterium]